MKKYRVSIPVVEVIRHEFIVEADGKGEAERLAIGLYEDGDFSFDSNFISSDIDEGKPIIVEEN